MARYNDANKTALLMGHRSTDVLFNHYRNLVKAEAAEQFWTLAPAANAMPLAFPKSA